MMILAMHSSSSETSLDMSSFNRSYQVPKLEYTT